MGRARNVGVWTQRIAIAAVLAVVVGFAVRVGSTSSQSLEFRDPLIWLVSNTTGEVVQADAGSGEVTARVEVGSDNDSLQLVQHGADALVLNRTTGEVLRVNGSLLATGERSAIPVDTSSVLLGRGDDARVVTPTAVIPVDPTTASLGELVEVSALTDPVLDDDGVVWGLDPANHVLVVTDRVDELSVPDSTRPFALVAPGGSAQLLDGNGPSLRALESAGSSLGSSSCVGGDVGAGVAVGGSVDQGRTVVMVDSSTGTVRMSDLSTGRCTSATIENAAGARFGASVESGGVAYVPILSTGEVAIVRVAEGTVVERVTVTGADREFELTVKDGTVWFNEPSGPRAGVLGPDGLLEQVDKYQEVAVSGAVEGDDPGEGDPGDGSTDGSGPVTGTDTEPGVGQPGPQVGPTSSDGSGGQSQSVGSNGGADGPVEDVALSGLVADFTYSKRVVEVGEEVSFADRSQGGPVSWTWEFGDGSFATGPEATHSWSAVGAYRVTLRIEGETGTAAATATIEVIDENTRSRPNADFRYSASRVEVGQRVTFTDRSTGNATELTWDFGDGSAASGPSVEHQWARAGTYQVALTARNALGSDTSEPATITVFDRVERPTAVIQATTTAASVNQSVTFSSASTGNPTSIEWTFDDGTSARGERVSHAWTSADTYTVRLRVSNSAGSSEATVRVVVDERVVVPEARAIASVTTAEVGQAIRFTSLSINNPTTVAWDFADGSPTDNGSTVTHTFARAGRYPVTLRATNSAGSHSTTLTIIIVADVPAPIAAFATAPEVVTAGTPVQFLDQSTGGAPTSWLWDFDDGTSTSVLKDPTHVFDKEGRYRVRLQVENSGGKDDVTRTIDVRPPAPIPDFTFQPAAPTVGQEVTFRDTSRNVTAATTWQWDFGDGTTSTQQNPRKVFNERRAYTVKLTVTNGPGSSTEVVKTVNVNPRPAAANFSFTPRTNVTTNTAVQFTFVQAAQTGVPETYLWNFGDGSTSAEPSPRHTFGGSGNYDVTLTVSNAGNASPSVSPPQRIRVTVQPPAPSFTIAATPRLVGTNLVITNTTPSVPGTTYQWNFDDGSPLDTAATPNKAYTSARPYTITLRAIVEGISQTPFSMRIVISPAITAGFTVPATVDSGQLVAIDNTSTGADTYAWTFSDGTPATAVGAEPAVRFTNLTSGPVTRTLTMTASNPGGSAAPVSRTITVRAALPVADFDMTGAPDGTVTVVYKQTPNTGAPTDYEWEFSDGFDAPNAAQVSHVLTGNGQRRVRLVVRNATGASAASTWRNVPDLPDTIDFDWSPGLVIGETNVRFTNRSPGPWTLVEWDTDGDGDVDQTGTTTTPVAVRPGDQVSMWVTHEFWGRFTVTKTISVIN